MFRTGALGERSVEGAVVGVDAATDLAVVRVDPHAVDLTVLQLGDSGSLEVGDTVYSLGNALDYDFSMTQGIVSALHRVLFGPGDALIREGVQTDAAVNSGDSGGPLLDARGVVVGVNERIATPGGAPTGNVGLAFAVPVDTVKDVLRQLRTTGTIVRPWIGVEALTITPAAVQLLEPGADRGVLLVDVTADGPAATAGLRGGERTVACARSAGSHGQRRWRRDHRAERPARVKHRRTGGLRAGPEACGPPERHLRARRSDDDGHDHGGCPAGTVDRRIHVSRTRSTRVAAAPDERRAPNPRRILRPAEVRR